MNEIATTLIASFIAGGAALIGAYLGTRWAFGRFLQERRFDELVQKRDMLRDFVGDSTDFEFFFGNCADDKIDKGMGKELLTRLVHLEAHFINDLRVTAICSVIEEFVGIGLNGKLSHSEAPYVSDEFGKLQEILAELDSSVQGEHYSDQVKRYYRLAFKRVEIENRRHWWQLWRPERPQDGE